MPLFAFGYILDVPEPVKRVGSRDGLAAELVVALAHSAGLRECFVTSSRKGISCFAEGGDKGVAIETLFQLFCERTAIEPLALQRAAFFLQGPEAVSLFLRQASGLNESLQPTENLEVFRSDFEIARKAGLAGPCLSKLNQRGLWLAEKVRMDLSRRRQSINIDGVILDLAEKIFGDLNEHTALIASTSDCTDVVESLLKRRIGQLLFLEENGTLPDLSQARQGRVVKEAQLESILPNVDLVCLFDYEMARKIAGLKLARIMNKRKNAPQLWVSLFENGNGPDILDLSRFYNVYSYRREDLEKVVLTNLKEKQGESSLITTYIQREVEHFYELLNSKEQYRFGDIIGKSEGMQRVLELVARIAHADISVLIDGESGTGKELVARAIHDHSSRVNNPFVVVNCGAIPESLLESELFGHVKGAFTGATASKIGLMEAANHGTIFLDEIGETSQATQVKLLRFLQEGEIKPVGSNETKYLDVRVITATNKHLEEMVERDLFRQDLFYRLNVIQITLPPLRARREDVMPLVKHFIKKYNEVTHKLVLGIEESAEKLLLAYDWPGNVRELENAIERAVALSSGSLLAAHDLPPRLHETNGTVARKDSDATLTLKDVEKMHIAATLNRHNWNYDLVTKMLGIGRTTLWRKMKEYQISN